MTTTTVSRPFYLAEKLWGNLEKFDGCHWGCGNCTDAVLYKWKMYDACFYPTPPPLNKRFLRMVVTCTDADFQENLRLLKLVLFYMRICSQSLYVSPLPIDTVMELSRAVRFSEVKKIDKDTVVLFKH